jgi:hypothetical protein
MHLKEQVALSLALSVADQRPPKIHCLLVGVDVTSVTFVSRPPERNISSCC